MENNEKSRMNADEFHIKYLCDALKEMTLSEHFGDKTPSKISELLFKWIILPIFVLTMLSLASYVACAVIAAPSSEEFSSKLRSWLNWTLAAFFLEMIAGGSIIIYEVLRKS